MAAVAGKPDDLWARLPDFTAEQAPTFVGIVRRWLETDGDPSDKALKLYVERLEDRGLKDGTINQNLNTIRRYIGFCGLPTPKCSWWHYDPQNADRPYFEPATVTLLVKAARRGPSVKEAAQLCVATIYGLRVSEIAKIRQQDVDLPHQRIFVRASKGSRDRWTWIPPEICPWLDVAWMPTKPRKVAGTLDALWGMAMEARRPPGAAWHAVRRSVALALGDVGVSEADVERFLRWKGRGNMARMYMHPNVRVLADGSVERVQAQDEGLEAADRSVWQVHPYVPLWSGG